MLSVRGVLIALVIAIFAQSGCALFAETPQNDQEPPSSKSNKPGNQKRVTSQQSIVVEVQSTPEEIEAGKINDVYQPVYQIQQQRDCERAIEKYKSDVIPMAERAKFEVPRNKFLFLAYRGIADCNLVLGHFVEAEETFQKLFEYLPVWPGTDDSDYPINFRSIGVARMQQQRWKDAEEPLQKAVSIFDEQIGRAAKSDHDLVRNEFANNYRMSQDMALNLLAVVYFREQRYAEALNLLEQAYKQAIAFHAPARVIEQIVENGKVISIDTQNEDAIATWSQRSVTSH